MNKEQPKCTYDPDFGCGGTCVCHDKPSEPPKCEPIYTTRLVYKKKRVKIAKYIVAAIAVAIALYYAINTGPNTDQQSDSDALGDAVEWAVGPASDAAAPKAHRPNPFKKHQRAT